MSGAGRTSCRTTGCPTSAEADGLSHDPSALVRPTTLRGTGLQALTDRASQEGLNGHTAARAPLLPLQVERRS